MIGGRNPDINMTSTPAGDRSMRRALGDETLEGFLKPKRFFWSAWHVDNTIYVLRPGGVTQQYANNAANRATLRDDIFVQQHANLWLEGMGPGISARSLSGAGATVRGTMRTSLRG